MCNNEYTTSETLDSSIKAIKNFSTNHPNDLIDVQIHGGEPLLYPLEGIKKVVYELKSDKIRIGITTNLVHNITEDYINTFKDICPDEKGPLITTSWDKDIRFRNKEEEIWKNNVKLLLSNNINVQPIICVTNILTKIDPKDIFSYMKSLGLKIINFERITLTGRAKYNNLKPLNREVDNWLYKAYIINKNFDFKIPLFESIESSINQHFFGCRARKCMRNVITINPNGTLAACPNTADNVIGRIIEDKFVFNELKKQNQIKKEERRENECLICDYFKYCNGDCCQLSFDESGCHGLKETYKYLLEKHYSNTSSVSVNI